MGRHDLDFVPFDKACHDRAFGNDAGGACTALSRTVLSTKSPSAFILPSATGMIGWIILPTEAPHRLWPMTTISGACISPGGCR